MPKRRVNLCINEDTWQRLKRHAERRQVSASVAVEEAIDRAVEQDDTERQRRMKAVAEIAEMELAPMGDWEDMEREIAVMYDRGCEAE